jgi:hypothetical protein
MNSISTLLQSTPLFQKLKRRQSLHVAARVVVDFDFDQPCGMADYDDAKRWCAVKFGSNFVWSARVLEKEATFGFTTFVDAVMFALWAPSARLSAS